MKKQLIKLFYTSFAILFCACSTDMTVIIDDYNTNFIPESKITHSGPSPGDEGFTEDIMLDNEYLVWSDATINISAPNECSEYSWIITDPEDSSQTPIPVHLFGTPELATFDEWTHQSFYLNIIDSGLTVNKVYKLTLTVVSKEGHTYKDVAALVIYQHFIF